MMGHRRRDYPISSLQVSGQKMKNFGGFIIFLKQEILQK